MATKKRRSASSAITIRNLPAPVAKAVREHAARYHVSLNKAVIQLLEGALEGGGRKMPIRDDLSRLAGSLPAAAARDMERALADMRKIHPDDWK